MRWYPWLRPAFEKLISGYRQGKGHHALLVQAQEGMGADALIYALSRWLMCRQPEENKSCGHCHSCRLMQAGTHPDYRVIAPEKGKTSLGVDAVRDAMEKLYDRSRMGGAKVVWIPETERLTEAAANALLKTLEEPPEECWFFLSCREPERLLATLRSRCFCYHLAPPDETFSVAWLGRENGLSAELHRAALRLCDGAPAAALELLTSERWELRQKLCAGVELALQSGAWLPLLKILNQDNAPEILRWLGSLLLDGIKWQHHAGRWIANVDYTALVAQIAQSAAQPVLQTSLTKLFHCREQLSAISGVNRELLLFEMLLSWENDRRPGRALSLSHL